MVHQHKIGRDVWRTVGQSEHERRNDFRAAVQPVQVVPSAMQAVRSLLMHSMQLLKR